MAFRTYVTATISLNGHSTRRHLPAMSARGKTDQLERRGWKEGREKSYCGRTDVFLSPLDSFFITSLNFKAFGTQPVAGSLEEAAKQ